MLVLCNLPACPLSPVPCPLPLPPFPSLFSWGTKVTLKMVQRYKTRLRTKTGNVAVTLFICDGVWIILHTVCGRLQSPKTMG